MATSTNQAAGHMLGPLPHDYSAMIETPNYHMMRVLKEIRHFTMKQKDITVKEYDAWIKSKVDEVLGEPYLSVVLTKQRS